jgi:hypothetical protein
VGQIIDTGTVGGGRAKIVSYIDAQNVKASTIIPFYTTAAIASGSWDYIGGYEDSWSITRGYPSTCLFFQQRLWLGGSRERPITIFGSRVDDYYNFLNIGNYPNDAIEITIASEQTKEIYALYANRGIQVFTSGDEWIIPEESLTPDTIRVLKTTSNGSIKGVYPKDVSGVTLFCEKNGKNILSFVYQDGQNSYITSQLSLLNSLIDNPIDLAIDYNSQKNDSNYVYIVNRNGKMVVACVLLDQKINSFVGFTLAKTLNNVGVGEMEDAKVVSVSVIGSKVYVLVNRQRESSDVYYTTLEVFDDVKVDCARLVDGGSATITGWNIHAGQTVVVYDSLTGDYIGEYEANNVAEVTLDEEPEYSVYIGLPFDYDITSNKLAINGQTGSVRSRISEAIIETNNTTKMKFCGVESTSEDDRFFFNQCTEPSRDTRFSITGSFDFVEILSILMRVNYGTR